MDVPKSQMMEDIELKNCTFVKTVLMLFIVFYHSILFWGGSWFVGEPVFAAKSLGVLADWLNTFHIYGFALVSGYLFYVLKYEKGKYGKFIPFVVGKVKRLIVPFAFVSLVWVVPISAHFFSYGLDDIFNKFCLGSSPGQLWFLLMLFDVFLIFWPLSDFMKNHHLLGLFLTLGMFAVGFVFNKVTNVFQISTALTYIPFFWIGTKIRQCGSKLIMKIPVLIWIFLDVAAYAATRYLLRGSSLFEKILREGAIFSLHIIGAIMIFAVLQKLAKIFNKWEKAKFLRLVANILCRFTCCINR